MAAMRDLSEAGIRRHASEDAFQQGQQLYRTGAVSTLVRRGDVLEAVVEGGESEPHRVRCVSDAAGIKDTSCTCGYAYAGWCKHVVAALLAVAHGDEIDERPPLDELLADLDRGQLQGLLLRLAGRDPDLPRAIEDDLRLQRAPPVPEPAPPQTASRPRRMPVDLRAVRRRMSAALHSPPQPSTRPGWYIFQLGHEAYQLLDEVKAFVSAGEGRAALEMLDVMTEECLRDWQSIMEDEGGQVLSFVQDDLGPAWTEAILGADLAPNERESWAARLDAWASEMEDYWDEGAFDAALQALDEGWDDPALQRILSGEQTGSTSSREGDATRSSAGRQLTIARLNVLERQGLDDQYLNLARAEGQVLRYTTMLVRRGRTAEAAEYGLEHLARAEEALTLAETLRDAAELEPALRVAARGLDLEGQKARLATWLADVARGIGRRELAVRAATVAFREEKSLTSYLLVQDLAGEEWPERRGDLLMWLRNTGGFYPRGPVDIFLHEGLIDEAIDVVDRDSVPVSSLIEQVADAAIETHPDWVIRASRRQAESIMGRAKAEAYGTAASWLAKAKQAYRIAGRESEWEEYLAGLLEQHRRKHKLVPLLKALGQGKAERI